MKNKVKTEVYPKEVLKPVKGFLLTKLETLLKRKKAVEKEDPYKDQGRIDENVTPDIEADEQDGHARSYAIKGEIQKTIIQVRKALSRIYIGKYGVCEKCGQMIDTDRLMIYPEATLCTKDARKK